MAALKACRGLSDTDQSTAARNPGGQDFDHFVIFPILSAAPRTVQPPGVQTVTASRLEILRKGETVRAERVVVYPGPADVLQETIEALGRYPFG